VKRGDLDLVLRDRRLVGFGDRILFDFFGFLHDLFIVGVRKPDWSQRTSQSTH
jgi:hypothetical protein